MKTLFYKILDIFFPCKHEFGAKSFEYISRKNVLFVKEYRICTKCKEIHSTYYKQKADIK